MDKQDADFPDEMISAAAKAFGAVLKVHTDNIKRDDGVIMLADFASDVEDIIQDFKKEWDR